MQRTPMLPKGTSVTLVEPRGPVNVGHVARLVRNFGVEKLYLVEPKVDLSVAAIYASHASGVLDGALVARFEKVRKDHELLVATTAVRASKKSNIVRRTVSPDRLHEILSAAKSSSLVFGRDTTGLTNEEIKACDVTLTIDASPAYRALNVGHAAAIVLYVASRGGRRRGGSQGRMAREIFARSFYELAEASRLPRHKTQNLFEAAKRIAALSGLTDVQLNLLSGVFRKAVTAMNEPYERGSKT